MSADIIDANVFVHLFDHADETTRATASRLVTDAVHEGTGVIGFQVVQETLNVVTRNLQVARMHAYAVQFLDDVLSPLWRVVPTTNPFTAGT